MTIIRNTRSLLFDALFYIGTATYLGALSPLSYVVSRATAFTFIIYWTKGFLWLSKYILGLDYKMEGFEENVPKGPCIIACKHQSTWETFIFNDLFNNPAVVYKKELSALPFFGVFLRKLDCIEIDRSAGVKAIKILIEKGAEAKEEGRKIMIFPEGTRGIIGEPGVYQPGLAALYTNLDLPVVPVAVNTGLFWGRRNFFKKPGVLTLRFLKPIKPGLNRKEFNRLFEETLEAESMKLYEETKNDVV